MKVESRRIEMESKVGGYNYDSAAITPLFDSHTTAVRLRDDYSITCAHDPSVCCCDDSV